MNSFRRKLNNQITNQNEESGTSLFNKVSGIAIAISIFLAVLETESHIEIHFGELIRKIDLVIGFLFCIEYLCRLWVSPLQHRYGRGLKGVIRYMLSPLAVIDAVAIFPTFIGALGSQFYVLRVIRLLRIAKVGRSKRFQQSLSHFNYAISSKGRELQLAAIYTGLLLLVSSTLMYFVESKVQPELFGSIPRCIWWAITTVTTVGYGDAVPISVLGKVLASITALLGIGVVAVPTGILAAGFSESISKGKMNDR